MRKHRFLGAIVLSVFVAASAAPVLAGGNDGPAVPPAGHGKNQTSSSSAWVSASLGWLTEVFSIVWGGGSPKPKH